MTWKSYVIVSGAGLLATYLVSTPPATTTPPRAPAAGQPAAAPAPGSSVNIVEEAARLQARVRDDIEYQEPSRNPFRYARRPAPRASAPAPEVVAEEPPVVIPPPQPPSITVAGIATTSAGGVSTRTAILITSAGPIEVKEGDPVGAEYRVVRIEPDAVELAAADGTRRRLSLRP